MLQAPRIVRSEYEGRHYFAIPHAQGEMAAGANPIPAPEYPGMDPERAEELHVGVVTLVGLIDTVLAESDEAVLPVLNKEAA